MSLLPDLVLAALGVLLACLVLVVVHAHGSAVTVALHDPATVAGFPFYLGAVSNMGVALLWVTATATLFAALTGVPEARVFSVVGVFSIIIALDDLFLLHEGPIREVLPWFEIFMYALYACAAAAVLWLRRRLLWRKRQISLLLAFFFLGASASLDTVVEGAPLPKASEDMFKFTGYLFWAIYWCRWALEDVRAVTKT